ncbi:hypothetical protein BGZ96_006257 [Linnemannia gamsii]|uniref:PXA domain-containing protein n=1 Tax=Linnemannia gamsii TaxID=64522 RepID=A0ABQ7K546_9FUNG|nr:hypothetical protein BGZ96_006257 [Linnemannia gamsii]
MSLFLLSTTALPLVIPPQQHHPYDSLSSTSSSSSSSSPSSSSSSQQSYGHFYAQDPSSRRQGQIKEQIVDKDGGDGDGLQSSQPQQPGLDNGKGSDRLGRDTHAIQNLVLTRPSLPLPQHRQDSALSPADFPLPSRYPSPPIRPSHHQHDLRVQTFKNHGPISPQDQILHQCTTHFLALLDTEISDRLLAQLSRLVMMLPVIGVETRAVIRSKVTEVMGSVIGGLKHYEAIEKVIRTAVDDAGGIQLLQLAPSSLGGNSPRDDDLFVAFDDSRNDQISEYDDVDGDATTSTTTTTTTGMIDESQIPVITDIAMEAVLDYMTEILTPSLVIHQLTEAIQTALSEISKQRKALHRMRQHQQQHSDGTEDEDLEDINEVDFDLDDLSRQTLRGRLSTDRHGLELLSDGWVWSGPPSSPGDRDGSSSRDRNSISSLLEDDEEDEYDDPRGQDEDLWDKDMETHQWDSTGRLFEDFEEDEDNLFLANNNDDASYYSSSQNVLSKSKSATTTKQDMENWDLTAATFGDDDGDDGEIDEDYESDLYSIGIRESDDSNSARNDNDTSGEGGAEDEEDGDDPMADTSEDYGRERYLKQSYFNRFHKRSLFASPPTDAVKHNPQKAAAAAGVPSLQIIVDNPKPATTTTTAKIIRRPNLTPDLRLENLLTQLIEPLLTIFIEEDFPASCKRVQGELMDEIIWSLDQSELNGTGHDGLDSDEERVRMLLLSELEY